MRTPAAYLRSLKRRRPGVYAYRTRRHLKSGTEWGYVGKARNLATRDKCHHGTCHHNGCVIKPWMDLEVRRYTIRLPWWLGFDWITLSLETLVILALQPRYNWQKNPRKDKVGPRTQVAQRMVRDLAPARERASFRVDRLVQFAGLVIIAVGIGGYLWNR
jgi:excinuclease UvrABC nuclease subunit